MGNLRVLAVHPQVQDVGGERSPVPVQESVPEFPAASAREEALVGHEYILVANHRVEGLPFPGNRNARIVNPRDLTAGLKFNPLFPCHLEQGLYDPVRAPFDMP